MNDKPRLLDLFCGAGGAGMGYHRAGFEVVGVDIAPQKHYPFEFHQGDALEYAAAHGHKFDAIHASPPCQKYSQATRLNDTGKKHPDLIVSTRFWLETLGLPYIIENVGGARNVLRNPFMLCGTQFGLKVYRHRFFESSVMIFTQAHQPHNDHMPSAGRGMSEKGFLTVAGGGYGHGITVEYARAAMGVDWYMPQGALHQAIPPAYTEWIGRQLMAYVTARREKTA